MQINTHQYDLLLGFYAHCYSVYQSGSKPDFCFWAEQLDNDQVPWSIQNTVAVIAETKESIALLR
jgi:hypothetical protein